MFRSAFVVIAFLSVLILSSQANAQMGAIASVDEPPERSGPAEGGGTPTLAAKTAATKRTPPRATTRSTRARTSSRSTAVSKPPPAKSKKAPANYDGFVVGDKYTFLNFEVVSAEKPYHTRAAKASGAKGLVQVEVLVDEDGSVLTARGRTGNKELWPEAERAALASKFNQPTFGGKRARAIGFLVYRFGPAED